MTTLTEYNSQPLIEPFYGKRKQAILKTKLFAVLIFAFIASLAISGTVSFNTFKNFQIDKFFTASSFLNIFSEKAGSFIIEEYIDGSWRFVTKSSFPGQPYPDRYTTKIFTLPQPSDRIRIIHDGDTQTAHLDKVVLDNNIPNSVQDLYDNNPLPIKKFANADYDVVEARSRTLEFSWDKKGSFLEVVGVAENFKGVPYRWPEQGYLTYKIGDKKTYTFSEIPVSSHPFATRYAYFSADKKNLYINVDWTSDNTLDIDKNGDWVELGIQTKNGLKTFLVKGYKTEWGTSAFEYTNKVSWQHKTYSILIPLNQIGLNYNEYIQFQIRYYGTDGGGGGGDGGGGDGGGDGGGSSGGDSGGSSGGDSGGSSGGDSGGSSGANSGGSSSADSGGSTTGGDSGGSANGGSGGSTPACIEVEVSQAPVACSSYAGTISGVDYGIPVGYTVGNASWTLNSCTNAITYTGGCTPPPVWVNYCTGGKDINGNNWQIWRFDNSNPANPKNWQFVENGTIANSCAAPISPGSCGTAANKNYYSNGLTSINPLLCASGNTINGFKTNTTSFEWTCSADTTVLCTATVTATVPTPTPTLIPISTPTLALTPTPTSTPTTTPIPTPSPTPTIFCTLSVASTSIATGSSSTLLWTTTNAATFSINTGIGNVLPVLSGSTTTPAINANTTFTGTAIGAGGSATCTATVTVTPVVVTPPPPPPSGSGGGGPIVTVPGPIVTVPGPIVTVPGVGGGGIYLNRQKLSPYTGITLASYVYLSQLPYTGMNNLDTILFFIILILISGVGSYQLTRINSNRQKEKLMLKTSYYE